MAERYDAEMTVPEWRKRLVCGKCGSRHVDFVVTGARRPSKSPNVVRGLRRPSRICPVSRQLRDPTSAFPRCRRWCAKSRQALKAGQTAAGLFASDFDEFGVSGDRAYVLREGTEIGGGECVSSHVDLVFAQCETRDHYPVSFGTGWS